MEAFIMKKTCYLLTQPHDAAAHARVALQRPNKRRLAQQLIASSRRRRAIVFTSVISGIALTSIAYLLE